MQQIDLLHLIFPDKVDFEPSVEIFVLWIFLVVPIIQLEKLVNQDDSSLHSIPCNILQGMDQV
jgi:hypothetical protein